MREGASGWGLWLTSVWGSYVFVEKRRGPVVPFEFLTYEAATYAVSHPKRWGKDASMIEMDRAMKARRQAVIIPNSERYRTIIKPEPGFRWADWTEQDEFAYLQGMIPPSRPPVPSLATSLRPVAGAESPLEELLAAVSAFLLEMGAFQLGAPTGAVSAAFDFVVHAMIRVQASFASDPEDPPAHTAFRAAQLMFTRRAGIPALVAPIMAMLEEFRMDIAIEALLTDPAAKPAPSKAQLEEMAAMQLDCMSRHPVFSEFVAVLDGWQGGGRQPGAATRVEAALGALGAAGVAVAALQRVVDAWTAGRPGAPTVSLYATGDVLP